MIDRRSVPRWEINSPVTVYHKDDNISEVCCMENLNLKGMRASFSNPLPERSLSHLGLFLLNDFHMDVSFTVCWKQEVPGHNVYGLEFHSMKDEDKDALYQYLHNKVGHKWEEYWWAVKEY